MLTQANDPKAASFEAALASLAPRANSTMKDQGLATHSKPPWQPAMVLPPVERLRVHQAMQGLYHVQRQHCCFIHEIAMVLIDAGRQTMVGSVKGLRKKVTVKVRQMTACQLSRVELSSGGIKEWTRFHSSQRMGAGIKI